MRKHPLSLPGIYRITCDFDGKVYVGQARKVSQRLTAHRSELERGRHKNGPLQEAWNAHGAEAFSWDLVAQPLGAHDPETMTLLEREVMSAYVDRFNLMEPVQAYLGAGDSTRARLSVINTAKWADPAYKARLSESHKRHLADPENLERRRQNMREVNARPETSAAKSAGQKRLWDEDGRREARGVKTKAHWEDPEHRAKQEASRKAAWQDPEKRENRQKGLKASWASLTPEEHAARVDAASAKQRSPEGRALAAEKARLGWEKRRARAEVEANPMRSRIEVTF